jgi:hypothetical protein
MPGRLHQRLPIDESKNQNLSLAKVTRIFLDYDLSVTTKWSPGNNIAP